MATQEETLRIINEVRGVESIEDLKIKLKELADSQEKLEQASGRASHGTRNLGWAALEASRAIEDLQYGFNGVVNNIPGLVMALGGTAGLTAVISLVSIGVNQLIKHWDDLVDVFGRSGTSFDTAKTNMDNLGKAIEANHKELKKLKEVQNLSNEQQERYNFLTEQATRLTIAKTREEEKHKAAIEARMAAEGKPEISPEIAAGLKGMAAPQVQQMIRGVAETIPQGRRDQVARLEKELASIDTTAPGGVAAYTAKLGELNRAKEILARMEREAPERAEEAVGLARRGEVPAFQQIQDAARAQPFRFQGLEQFFGMGPTRTPEQEVHARKRAAEQEAHERKEFSNKVERGRREAQRLEDESERLAKHEADRQRREEAQGIDAQNRMDELGKRNADRARRERERETRRAVGEELGTEAQAQRAGMGAAEKWFEQLAHQQARATGMTVQNQMEMLRNNEMVRQQYNMIYENAAMVRRMVIQQNQKTRRDLEERRNQQNNGE